LLGIRTTKSSGRERTIPLAENYRGRRTPEAFNSQYIDGRRERNKQPVIFLN